MFHYCNPNQSLTALDFPVRQRGIAEASQRPFGGPATAATRPHVRSQFAGVLRAPNDANNPRCGGRRQPLQAHSHFHQSTAQRCKDHHSHAAQVVQFAHRFRGRHPVGQSVGVVIFGVRKYVQPTVSNQRCGHVLRQRRLRRCARHCQSDTKG